MPLASTGVDVPVVAHHDLMALADMRLAEARALQNGRHYSGAFYLAGYAVELGIKSIIARDKFRGVWPEKDQFRAGYTHNLEDLMQIAGLLVLLAQDSLRDEELDENWRIVRRWRETARAWAKRSPSACAPSI